MAATASEILLVGRLLVREVRAQRLHVAHPPREPLGVEWSERLRAPAFEPVDGLDQCRLDVPHVGPGGPILDDTAPPRPMIHVVFGSMP